MSIAEYTVRVALFCLIPLALTGILWVLSRIAIRRGWLVKRREPTEYDLALQRLHDEMNNAMAEIGKALMPVMQNLAVELNKLFPPPPLTRWQRLRRWFR